MVFYYTTAGYHIDNSLSIILLVLVSKTEATRERNRRSKEKNIRSSVFFISESLRDNSQFHIEKCAFEDKYSGMKSFIKNSFVMSIKELSSIDDCSFFRVLIKEGGIVKSYLIPICNPDNPIYSFKGRTFTYAIHYMNVSFLLETMMESSCDMLYTVIHTVLRVFGYIKETDVITLLSGKERIPMSPDTLRRRISHHPITVVIASSHSDDSDEDSIIIDYTSETIDSFLSNRWYHFNTNVVLDLSWFHVFDMTCR